MLREVRIYERSNSGNSNVSEERGGGGAPGAKAEVPTQPVVKTMVSQAVPMKPLEVSGGDPWQSRWMPEKGL